MRQNNSFFNSRPTLYIGLGGAGIRVVSTLRSYLRTVHPDMNKSLCRFVGIDIESAYQLPHEEGGNGTEYSALGPLRILNDIDPGGRDSCLDYRVALDLDATVTAVTRMKSGAGFGESYPTLRDWFPVPEGLTETAPYHLSKTATGLLWRPIGRLAWAFNYRSIYSTLSRAYSELSQGRSHYVRAVVAGYLGGGVCGGTFWDAALMLRRMESEVDFEMLGYFMLHATESDSFPEVHRRNNVDAALTEMDAYLKRPAGTPLQTYTPGAPRGENLSGYPSASPVFDRIYLYKPKRSLEAGRSEILPGHSDCLKMAKNMAAFVTPSISEYVCSVHAALSSADRAGSGKPRLAVSASFPFEMYDLNEAAGVLNEALKLTRTVDPVPEDGPDAWKESVRAKSEGDESGRNKITAPASGTDTDLSGRTYTEDDKVRDLLIDVLVRCVLRILLEKECPDEAAFRKVMGEFDLGLDMVSSKRIIASADNRYCGPLCLLVEKASAGNIPGVLNKFTVIQKNLYAVQDKYESLKKMAMPYHPAEDITGRPLRDIVKELDAEGLVHREKIKKPLADESLPVSFASQDKAVVDLALEIVRQGLLQRAGTHKVGTDISCSEYEHDLYGLLRNSAHLAKDWEYGPYSGEVTLLQERRYAGLLDVISEPDMFNSLMVKIKDIFCRQDEWLRRGAAQASDARKGLGAVRSILEKLNLGLHENRFPDSALGGFVKACLSGKWEEFRDLFEKVSEGKVPSDPAGEDGGAGR
ncbi:tubulin-like doman-containing protein [Desulfovibrio sp. JC010]|uniref:tubulin-like doman-containing protein n=1 Tax=Desulfovibrio sp. JC010 TaxID=2593641 RepID=UPI0013D86F1D